MLLKLKQYQSRALDALKEFFHLCGVSGDPGNAFVTVAARSFEGAIAYRRIDGATGLDGIPYVCLRVPTGGGKTLMACHAVPHAIREYKQVDDSLVLWLVPSNTILEQTYAALSDPSHPYREALDMLMGPITIKKVEDALYLSRGDVDGRTCIILSTLQAFRRDNKDGLRVYKTSGNLQPFFDSATLNALGDELEKDEKTGLVAYSLANVIAMRHPVVIVDEAHNARTPLTFDILSNFHPACILEFTATPDTKINPSNVLYSVSANELKAEEMIKLPILVEGITDSDWRPLLQRAINCRNNLEQKAELERQTTGEYIRPIMLLQAQRKSQVTETFHAERLKEVLITDCRIPEAQVRIATGDKREIDGLDLFAPDCEVRYIITQQALKEGWDCSFAYVLCSIFETGSHIEVEQILGRVLRMPQAKRKTFAELNSAYAFAPARFEVIAASLKDAMTQNGFDKFESEQLIRQITRPPSDDLFDAMGLTQNQNGDFVSRQYDIPIVENIAAIELPPIIRHKVEARPASGKVILKGQMTLQDRDVLTRTFPASVPAINRVFAESNNLVSRIVFPAERGADFSVPWLVVRYTQDELDLFDETALLEYPMDVSQLDARLPEYTPNSGYIQIGKVDMEAGKVTAEVIERIQQDARFFDFNAAHHWSLTDLVRWIDDKIEHRDITAGEATAFFARVLTLLVSERQIPLETLVMDRFRLVDVIRRKLNQYRLEAAKEAYQDFLLPDFATPLAVSEAYEFRYGESYPASRLYQGGYKFRKHYYATIGEFDGKENGEEEHCAQFIDQLDEVEYWVRNLDSRPNESFWFQLHKNKFYPDFVCKLKDGRILVVEHKGADRYTNEDSVEKRTISELWAQRSHGKCLFVMTTGRNFDAINKCIRGEA